MKKFFFLDVAHTLWHKPAVIEGWLTVLEDHGYVIDPQVFRRLHKLVSELVEFPDRTDKSFYEQFNAKVLMALGITPETTLMDQLYTNLSDARWEPFEDTKYLKSIEAPMGIISNWDRSLLVKLNDFGLNFDPIIGSEESGFKKPDQKIFRHALAQLSASYDEIYYVGDSIKLDILPAKEAGLIPILIDRYNDYPYFKGIKIASFQPLMSI